MSETKTSAPDDLFRRDYFSLFALPRCFALDEEELSARYRVLQDRAHPDRYAGKSAVERRLAVGMASRINDAYATLKNPLSRAAYILSLRGFDVFAESSADLPVDFLEEQMEWRERLTEATNADMPKLAADILAARAKTAALAEALLMAEDWPAAVDTTRRWRYWDKLLEEAGR